MAASGRLDFTFVGVLYAASCLDFVLAQRIGNVKKETFTYHLKIAWFADRLSNAQVGSIRRRKAEYVQ
ncbi:hypothetical protein PY092_16165 [Muricauda sp. 334s03]|uniref:Uncharacterized protein n=1 Tax=Flagellimonas yonaguniensis TaxID=3031325 RepID=A0ABT5Y2M0_9FLAO|nr:hypothetical protein [[Muricauda] yonaguniensis]MDF0717699.1 hypothetical protein [[Muricauda] yonaguniensis]